MEQLRSHRTAVFSIAAFIVFSVSVVLKEAIAQFSLWAGKKVRSQALAADGWHHRSDALASALIIVGALFQKRFLVDRRRPGARGISPHPVGRLRHHPGCREFSNGRTARRRNHPGDSRPGKSIAPRPRTCITSTSTAMAIMLRRPCTCACPRT
jgi:hypothetical protein